jgi:hypothetical protein
VDVKGKGLMATYLVDPADAPRFYHRPSAMDTATDAAGAVDAAVEERAARGAREALASA